MRRTALWLSLVLVLVVSALTVLACSAFGGSDVSSPRSGLDAGVGADGDPPPAVTDGTDAGAGSDAADAACVPLTYELSNCSMEPLTTADGGTANTDPMHSPAMDGGPSCSFNAPTTATAFFEKSFTTVASGMTTLEFEMNPTATYLDSAALGCWLRIARSNGTTEMGLATTADAGSELIVVSGMGATIRINADLPVSSWSKVAFTITPASPTTSKFGIVVPSGTSIYVTLPTPPPGPGTITLSCGVVAPSAPLKILVDSVKLTVACPP